MAKVSKNARTGQRAANAGSGRDYIKVIKSIKNPDTGKYSYKEVMGVSCLWQRNTKAECHLSLSAKGEIQLFLAIISFTSA